MTLRGKTKQTRFCSYEGELQEFLLQYLDASHQRTQSRHKATCFAVVLARNMGVYPYFGEGGVLVCIFHPGIAANKYNNSTRRRGWKQIESLTEAQRVANGRKIKLL